jgi:hypothetical protein
MNITKEKYLIVLLNLIALISTTIGIYKSNVEYFAENTYTITFFIYLCIMVFSILLIKNNKYLLAISIMLFLDIPFIFKSNAQNFIINLELTSSLLYNHLIIFFILVIILITIYIIIKKAQRGFLYFLLLFYSIALVKNIFSPNTTIKDKLKINQHVASISKSYYFLLFDEYPNEIIIDKYTKINKRDFISSFLLTNGFKDIRNIYSNYVNTQNSTTALLTGVIENNYSINQAINSLTNNVFSDQKDYQYNYISIFDEANRKNSLVIIQFFESNKSLLYRYIIPYLQHFFSKRGIGLFTNYEDYHNQILSDLNRITKSKIKNVTYVHFYTPHNYPLVENQSLEDRIRNANQWIRKSISTIEKNDKNAGIVIFSDHGLRLNNIPKMEWKKNMLFYKNIKIDTASLSKSGLSGLFNSITY